MRSPPLMVEKPAAVEVEVVVGVANTGASTAAVMVTGGEVVVVEAIVPPPFEDAAASEVEAEEEEEEEADLILPSKSETVGMRPPPPRVEVAEVELMLEVEVSKWVGERIAGMTPAAIIKSCSSCGAALE